MTLTRIDIDLTEEQLRKTLVVDASRGLLASMKVLPPKYFYDQRGSDLFQRITALPEYYPARIERRILSECAAQIVRAAPAFTSLVELGSGSSTKTPLLLDAMIQLSRKVSYVPVDVSIHALVGAIGNLREAYPRLPIHGVVMDFERPLGTLPQGGRRMVAFLGGTIGNLDPENRTRFLNNVAATLAPCESFLLGVDLVKDPVRLVQAYDDATGVTAQFNLNILNVLNRLLAANFDPERFEHVALWDEEQSRIEMRLRAKEAMKVHLDVLETTVAFEEGEEIRTEVSAKFRRDALEKEFNNAGFELAGWWAAAENLGDGEVTEDYAVALGVRSRQFDA